MDNQQRILLILDLDETLIFATGNPHRCQDRYYPN